MQNWDQFY